MKKNFFKKLAFGLAATMVVTAATPAAGNASAAAAPSLNKKAKNLYLNNDAVGKSFNFNINNKVKGSKYKWTSSDTSIATVNSKNGVATGKKVGTVKISCKITLPTKKTKTLTATVNVKKNATAIAINNVPENNVIGIGEKAYNFNRDLTDKDATDKTFWIIDEESNTAGATVNTANGVVSTTKAGEFKITAYTYQNKDELAAKNWTATSETVTIKVKAAMTEVKQTGVTKLVVTFDDNMSSVITKSSFDIASAAGVKSVVKSVEFADDGKQVTVETHTEFEDKITYKVTYDGKTMEFVASKGEPSSVVVTPKTVQYATPTEFTVQIFDANNIDLTTDEMLKNTTYDYDQTVGYIDTSDSKPKLNMYNYDKTLNVKAVYHTWKYVDNKEVVVESATVTFNSVKELKNTVKDFKATIETSRPDWDKINNTMTAESRYKLFIKAKNQNGDELTISDCTFTSTDNSTLQVTTINNETVELYGVKAGSAYVKCVYGDSTEMIPVTVAEKSKATSLKTDPSSVTLYGSVQGSDNVVVTLKVYDQLGKEITYVDQVGSPVKKSSNTIKNGCLTASAVAGDKNKVEFKLNNAVVADVDATAGTHTYEIEYYGLKTNISVNVVKKATNINPSYYNLDFSSSSPVNVKLDLDDMKANTLTIKPIMYSTAGQKLYVVSGSAVKSVSVQYAENSSSNYTEIATSLGGNSKTKAYYTNNDGILDISLAYLDDNTYVQAKTGTYKVTYVVTVGTTDKTVTQSFAVENTQSIPLGEVKKVNADAGTLGGLIEEAIKFTLDGSEIKFGNYTIREVDASLGSGRVVYTDMSESIGSKVSTYLYSISIGVETGTAGTYIEYKIPINGYVTRN